MSGKPLEEARRLVRPDRDERRSSSGAFKELREGTFLDSSAYVSTRSGSLASCRWVLPTLNPERSGRSSE